jgi:hypothetical protein
MLATAIAIAVALLLQTAPAQPQSPGTEARTWTGCIQAGTAPSTYRLNLDEDTQATTGTAGTDARPGNAMGRPFVHLVSGTTDMDLTKHVGTRVRITGRELTPEEAEQEAAKRPNRQEAAETAAGTGGESPGHFRYVRVQKIEAAPGTCDPSTSQRQ